MKRNYVSNGGAGGTRPGEEGEQPSTLRIFWFSISAVPLVAAAELRAEVFADCAAFEPSFSAAGVSNDQSAWFNMIVCGL